MPKISIIIPIFNTENYLADCLNSLQKQTFSDWEAICVDDGSTDGSLQLLHAFAEKDQRFRILEQEHQGQSVARNTGILAATGEYLCFLDSDDMFTADALETLWRSLEREPVPLLSFEVELEFSPETIGKEASYRRYYEKAHTYSGTRAGKELFAEMTQNQEFVDSAGTLCVNRQWLKEQKLSFYPEIFFEDCIFSVTAFWKAKKARHLSQKLYRYRVRSDSTMTSTRGARHLYSRLVCLRELQRLLLEETTSDAKAKEALTSFLETLVWDISRYRLLGRIEDEKLLANPIDRLNQRMLRVGMYCEDSGDAVLLKGLETLIRESKGTVLYGAGKIGTELLLFAEKSGVREKIFCFAVSEEKDTGEKEGLPIVPLHSLQSRDYFVILAARKYEVQREMEKYLNDLGFSNFITVSEELIFAIRRFLGKESL